MRSALGFVLALSLVPLQSVDAATSSVRVYPSGATVPQRLLRISLAFAAPQDEAISSEVRMGERGAGAIDRPFADPALWSPDHRVVTFVLDPSRQKTGLDDHARYGFVLPAGRYVELRLGDRVLKTWYVRGGGCGPLDPARWALRAVHAGTRETLVVRLTSATDVMSREYLAVARTDGVRVAGRTALADAERRWSFVPTRPWQKGDRLAVHPRLENPCGDEVGEPFEHAAGAGLGTVRTARFLPLDVVARARETVLRS